MSNNFLQLVESKRPDIESLLPGYMNPSRFFALVKELERNPKLMDCTAESILECVIHAAQCGFEIGGPDQHCYLIPYGKQAQLQAGWKGMVYRAVQAHAASHIFADVVCQSDVFKVISGTKRELIHEPASGDRGKVIKVYAVAILPNGITDFEVLDQDDLDAIEKAALRISGGKASPAWQFFKKEMQKKSAIKRLLKRLQGDRCASPDELDRLRATMELKADIDLDRVKQAEAANADLPDPPARKANVEIVPDSKTDADQPLSDEEETMLYAALKAKGVKPSQSNDWVRKHCMADLGLETMDDLRKGHLMPVMQKLEA